MQIAANASLNVKDFGAKGDNVTDDTAAIQAAFDAQRKFPYDEVLFPAGAYRIRDTIRMYHPNVKGQGSASIYQEAEGKDTFYVEFAWRGSIRDLTFYKGAKQLNLGNPNIDQGLIKIENCTFNESTDFAIYMRVGSNSSFLDIRGCVFSFCEQVLHTTCDWTTLSSSWITTARMNNKAAIENRGAKLACEGVVGVPIVTGQNDRWIDNYGSLTCRNFRFGGEFGGMTPVYNFVPHNKSSMGPVLILEDCFIAAQGSGRKCAVYLHEIPNIVTIKNCNLSVPAFMLARPMDLKTYFSHARPGMVQFDVQSNIGEYNDDPQTLALLQAARNRDTSQESLAGQFSAKTTSDLLAKIVAHVKASKPVARPAAEANGHRQKTDSRDYVNLNTPAANWDIDDFMDATTVKNSQYVARAQAGDSTLFMRRAPNGPAGAWPHVLIRNVIIDLDKTPWITWKQRDPGTNPRPAGAVLRTETNKIVAPGIEMPMGFALRIMDNETRRMVLLAETHSPPWFDYGAKDLRKLFDVKGGKRTFTIKYFPLGTYIESTQAYALPGDYQILDFIRAEAD